MTENHEHDLELEEEIDFQTDFTSLMAYERAYDNEQIPAGFTSVTCSLDASMHSSLCWDKAIEKAQKLVDSGYKVLFDLELGLFKKLTLPLKSTVQFQALALAIDHFQKQIVSHFQPHMVGVILLRSNLLFQKEMQWDRDLEENYGTWLSEKGLQRCEKSLSLFCRNVVIEYLELLVDHLSFQIPPLLLVDASSVKSPLLFAKLTALDCYKRLKLAIAEPLFAQGHICWEKGCEVAGYIGNNLPVTSYEQKEAKTAIVLPSFDVTDPLAYTGLEKVFLDLLAKKVPFKVISEEYITTEWSGLDSIHVCLPGISTNGRRKLAGFEAAGGKIISEQN